MSNPLNRKGFAAAEAILIVVILAILGGTGYYVYNANKKTNDTLDSASNTSQSSASKATNRAAAQKYLTVKEWDVKFKLNAQNSDAYYSPVEGNDKSMYLRSKAIDDFAAQHSECNTKINTVSRLQPGDNNAGSPWTIEELQSFTKIGNYYFQDGGGQPCFGNDVDKLNDSNSQLSKLRLLLPKAEDLVPAQ